MAEAKKGTLRNPGKTMRRALRFAARGKGARPALTHVHLDECGDVVATDSYRMYVEHGAWDGPSIDVPYGQAKELSKLKASAESAEVEGGDHGFPDYKKLFRGLEAQAVAHVDPKQLMPVLREHARMKNDHVVLAVDGRDLHVQGSGEKGAEPTARFGESCDGAGMRMGFNPKYLADALSVVGSGAEVRMVNPLKPAAVVDGAIEVLVMPVRLDAEPKRGGFKKAQPSPEPKGSGAPLDLGGECVCITGTLAGMTRGEAFTRLKLAGATPSEGFTKKVTVLAVAENAGKSKREKAERAIANGQAVRIVSGSELVAALMEQGRTAMEKREDEMVEENRVGIDRQELARAIHARAVDRAANDTDGRVRGGNLGRSQADMLWKLGKEGRLTESRYGSYVNFFLDGEFVCCIERRYSKRKVHLCYPELKPALLFEKHDHPVRERVERKAMENAGAGVDAKVTEDGDVTAIEMRPKPEAEAMPEPKPEAAPEPRAKAAPEAPEPPAGNAEEVAIVVTLDYMRQWCRERENVVATQKRPDAQIVVHGDSAPYKEELKDLGFRWTSRKCFWWYKPSVA